MSYYSATNGESSFAAEYLSDLSCAFISLRRTLESFAGDSSAELSAELWGSSAELPGEDVALDETEEGMGGIVRALAEQAGKEKVLF